MATMKKMVAKKATKKYNDGGELTMKDKTNTVVRDKDNSRMKSTTDNSVTNTDKSKVKYKIAKGATVSFAKSGKTIKKAQQGVPIPSKTTDTITATNPRKGFTSNTQPVNAAGEVTTGMPNPYKTTSKPKLSTGFKNGGKMMKAKSGAKFDLNKDGKTTFKDVLIGRGVLPKTAKKGASVKKAKSGASMKKCRYGCK
jgi:hypothetical protein